MAQENIQVNVDSSQLQALIRQLDEAQAELSSVKTEADQTASAMNNLQGEANQAASAMNNLGAESSRAGSQVSEASGQVQGFSISGAKAAVAGAAMGVAMVAVEKAMELAAQAAAAINQATIDYIRTSQAGRAAIDGYTEALERSKQEIAKAIADTGLYQKAAEGLTAILPQLTTEIIKGIGAIEDAITIYMEYKYVIDGVVGVIQKMIPGLQSVLDIIKVSKVVWDGTVQVLDSVATSIRESTTEVEEQTPAIQTATSTWDRLTGAMNNNIDSAINVGREYRAVAAVSELAGRLVGFFQPSLQAQADAADAAAAASAAYTTQMEAEAQALRETIAARNQLDDQVQSHIQRVLADDSAEIRIARERLIFQATDEQVTSLLALWEIEDAAREQRTRDEAERTRIEAEQARERERIRQQEVRDLEASISEAQRIVTEAGAEAGSIIAEAQARLIERGQTLYGPAFDLEDLENMSDKSINQLGNYSEGAISALGTLKTAGADISMGLASSLGSAALSGEKSGKEFKKIIGDLLKSQGLALALQGAAASIPPPFNPSGNPVAGATMIGIGGAMLGLSAAFGAGGGSSPSVAPPRAVGSSSSVSVQSNFGFVGDRRSAARDVAEVQRDATRRGL